MTTHTERTVKFAETAESLGPAFEDLVEHAWTVKYDRQGVEMMGNLTSNEVKRMQTVVAENPDIPITGPEFTVNGHVKMDIRISVDTTIRVILA